MGNQVVVEPDDPKQNSWAIAGAAARTKTEIEQVLHEYFSGEKPVSFPKETHVLEVASGFGEHIVHFAGLHPDTMFHPTEAQTECIEAIGDLCSTNGLRNLVSPLRLNARSIRSWDAVAKAAPSTGFTGIVAINLLHISPWDATTSLFANTARLLSANSEGKGWLAIYGTFRRNGQFISENDAKFQASLKNRDERWGIRDLDSEIIPAAEAVGLFLAEINYMRSNNFLLVFLFGFPKQRVNEQKSPMLSVA
ncbi:uncharacterized protein V1510DRAFT_53449 [Dipodascopsis tothii]|uniref:uncharacterized protein n=1 Tax=Dipodascopsis tothii TaxID=44089 RepID=UPI0034CDE20F